MPSDSDVEDFDVFEEALAGLGVGLVGLVVNEFFLQGGEERFHRCEEKLPPCGLFPPCSVGGLGCLPAVPFAAHRARDAMFLE